MQHLKHTMENISGVEIYPLISLMIFFLFFVALGIYVYRADKVHLEEMARSPLDDSKPEDSETLN